MEYQVDQSGKVEYTNKLTVVAFCNGKKKSILIEAVEKQKLMRTFRSFGFSKKQYICKVFAILIFLLIKKEGLGRLFIDRGYGGNENNIKNILTQYFWKSKLQPPKIYFKEIGRKSEAHKLAISVFRKEESATILIKAKDILRLI